MLTTESLLEVLQFLPRVTLGAVEQATCLFKSVVSESYPQLALHRGTSLSLASYVNDSTKWLLSIRLGFYAADSTYVDCNNFEEGFMRLISVLQRCGLDERCTIESRGSECTLCADKWRDFIDAGKASNFSGVSLTNVTLQLCRDEFSQLASIRGIREMFIVRCSLKASFVDNRFIDACVDKGITYLRIGGGPVDADYYDVDDDGVLAFCFKPRLPCAYSQLNLLLTRAALSAELPDKFKKEFTTRPFRGSVTLCLIENSGYQRTRGCRRISKYPPVLYTDVAEDEIFFRGG